MDDALKRAEYKLRQADVLLAHLRALPKEIARMQRSAVLDAEYHKLLLETHFFACLGAARSAYYYGRHSPAFQTERRRFLDTPSVERDRFEALIKLRDRDVHSGDVTTDALPTMIPAEDHGQHTFWHYQSVATGVGPTPTIEHTMPDGTKVTARALQGSVGLYVEVLGKKYDAGNACAFFIEALRNLMQAASSQSRSNS